MIKQISIFHNRKQLLQKQASQLLSKMIQGSLVKLNHRCGNKNCHCAKPKDVGHPAHYLSIPTPQGTQMHYLSKEILPELPKRLKAFKQYWEIGKKISQLNLMILKQSHKRRRHPSHVR